MLFGSPFFLFLDRFSSFFDMMVQMCASFRYQSVKTHFLLLPPELLPLELLPLCLLWKLCYPIQLPSQYGCPKTRLFQHNHMLVVSRIDSVLLKSSHLNSILLNPFPPSLLRSLGGRSSGGRRRNWVLTFRYLKLAHICTIISKNELNRSRIKKMGAKKH